MKTISFINEKGNVNATMRGIVREQVKVQLETALLEYFDEVSENEIGGYSLPIAKDRRTGETVYAHIDFAISNKEKVKPAKKGESATTKKAKTEDIEIPDLFGNDEEETEEEEIEEVDGEQLTAEV